MYDIYTGAPLTKIAYRVTDQSGCTSHEGFTIEQQRENLIARRDWLISQRKLTKTKKVYKSLGKEIFEVNKSIGVLSEKITKARRKDISRYIIDIVKARFTRPQWALILEEARSNYMKEHQE